MTNTRTKTPAVQTTAKPAAKPAPAAKVAVKSIPTKSTKPVAVDVAPPPTNKPNVISFRLSDAYHEKLKAIFDKDMASGVFSRLQHARKIIVDYIDGRIAYKDPADKLKDYTVLKKTI